MASTLKVIKLTGMDNAIITFFLGGLILFIFSISQLSKGLKEFFSSGAHNRIEKHTNTIWKSLLVGILATILMGSSSAVIIITIVLINARAITFNNSLGVILGANIGTTFTSQLIALNVSEYAVFVMALGLILMILGGKPKLNSYGQVLFFFGLLFFGLFVMEHSVLPLRESEFFSTQLTRIGDNPLRGVWVGGLTTLLIQSSSATVGIAILLGKQGLLSSAGGLAVMLGAELGTCSDTLLATINGSRAAFRAGVFHVLFNLLSITLGLLLFDQFTNLVSWLSQTNEIEKLIANGHLLFNCLGVLIILPFLGTLGKILKRLIPDKLTAV